MAKLMHELSHKTGTQNVGLFIPLLAVFSFLSYVCIRCMSLHPFYIPAFASQLRRWLDSGLLMNLH